MRPEGGKPLLPEKALQKTAVGFQQVDNKQAVDYTGKRRIDIKIYNNSMQLKVMA